MVYVSNLLNIGSANYGILVGAESSYLSLAPAVTAGTPLTSVSSSGSPEYTNVSVVAGGTGLEVFVPYGILVTRTVDTLPVRALNLDINQVLVGVGTTSTPAVVTLRGDLGLQVVTDTVAHTAVLNRNGWNYVDQQVASPATTLVTGTVYGARVTDAEFTLPTTAQIGDQVAILGVSGGWTLAQPANAQVRIDNNFTTVGVTGSVAGTDDWSSVQLLCTATSPNMVWRALLYNGTLTTS